MNKEKIGKNCIKLTKEEIAGEVVEVQVTTIESGMPSIHSDGEMTVLKSTLIHIIVKNETLLRLLEKGKKGLINWIDATENWVKANKELIAQKTHEYILYMVDALAVAVKAVKAFRNAWLGVKLIIAALHVAFNELIRFMYKGNR